MRGPDTSRSHADSDEQWRKLAEALGLDTLATDSRFANASDRKRNEDALDAELSRRLKDLARKKPRAC